VTDDSSADLVPPERDRAGRWVAGASGNPGGLPKADRDTMARVRALALQHSEAAVTTLVEIMADAKTPHQARIAAASAVLDRGVGRPTPQETPLLGDLGGRLDETRTGDLEKARRIAWLLEAGIRATRMHSGPQVPARLAADDDEEEADRE
jgi:hypothetical protein